MRHKTWLTLVLAVLQYVVDAQTQSNIQPYSYFNLFGAIPQTGELQASVGDTYYGYNFLCDYILEQGGFQIRHLDSKPVRDSNGNIINFAFNCSFDNNESNTTKNIEILEQQLDENNVDFYVGSHPMFEPEQAELISSNNKMLFECCVGPDEYYTQENVFGVQVSNLRYTELFIKQLSLRRIESISIISNQRTFELSTCQQAEQYGLGFELNTTAIYLDSEKPTIYKNTIESFIQEIKNNRTEALLGCVEFDDAINIMLEIDKLQIPLKSIFFTVAPSKKQFVDDLGYLSEYVLTAGQWHQAINYYDQYLNDTQTYVKLYKNYTMVKQNFQEPTYTSTGASAVIEYFMFAIKDAFIGCNISATNGDVKKLLYDQNSIDCSGSILEQLSGYEIIRRQMMRQRARTFFGEIQFNQYGRNIAMDPATIQVLSEESGNLTTQCVLPFIAASADIKLPQDNRYLQSCRAGYYQPEDQFDECQPCQKGYYKCAKCSGCFLCSLQQYNDEWGQAECKNCPKHSSTQALGSESIHDCVCEQGYFRNPSSQYLECLICPENGDCTRRNSTLQSLPGYWMDVNNPTAVDKCSPGRVCLGGEQSKCLQGYAGKLCANCDDSYYSVFNQCRACPSNQMIVLQVVGIVIAWWIINTVMSRQMETFDVILSWVQLLSVVGSYDMNWPPSIFGILNYASLFAFEVDIIDLSCIIPQWGFFHNFVVQLMMPIVVGVLALLSYFVSSFVYHSRKIDKHQVNRSLRMYQKSFTDRKLSWGQYTKTVIKRGFKQFFQLFFILPETSEELQRAKNYTIAVPLSFVSISYLTLVKYSFDSFKCTEFSGEYVMKSNIDTSCDTREYENIRILGIIGLVLYVVPFPIFCFIILRWIKKNRSFHMKKRIEQFGWLYNRYEVEWYWYEVTQIFHRAMFVLVLVFVDSPSMEASIAMLATIGLLMLHIYSRPYIDVILDILHTCLQIALMLLILSGLIFFNAGIVDPERMIVEYFILSTLAGFGIIFMGFLFKNIYEISLFMYAGYRVKNTIGAMALRMGDLDNVEELMHTFEVGFLRHWIWKASDKDLEALHLLSGYLAENVADESDTSYLSLTKTGRWWRYLSQRFPEVIDFLAVTDENSRRNFVGFVEILYSYFFKYKGGNNIYDMIRWEDRAAVAQWLTVSPPHARKAFNEVVESMFLHAKGKIIARDHLIRVVTKGRMQNSMRQRESSERQQSGALQNLWKRITQDVMYKQVDSRVQSSQISTTSEIVPTKDRSREASTNDLQQIQQTQQARDPLEPLKIISIEKVVENLLQQQRQQQQKQKLRNKSVHSPFITQQHPPIEEFRTLEDEIAAQENNNSNQGSEIRHSLDMDSKELIKQMSNKQVIRLLQRSSSSIHTSSSSEKYLNDFSKGPWERLKDD